jgi:hypothetical protein
MTSSHKLGEPDAADMRPLLELERLTDDFFLLFFLVSRLKWSALSCMPSEFFRRRCLLEEVRDEEAMETESTSGNFFKVSLKIWMMVS